MDFNFFNSDSLWHTLSSGALLTAALTAALSLARVLLDYRVRQSERRHERAEARQRHDRDAEARLERILQDRLAEADRRLERVDADLRAERVRTATLEHDLLDLKQAYALLEVEYAGVIHLTESSVVEDAGPPAR
jgi:uncharacterized protein HemX